MCESAGAERVGGSVACAFIWPTSASSAVRIWIFEARGRAPRGGGGRGGWCAPGGPRRVIYRRSLRPRPLKYIFMKYKKLIARRARVIRTLSPGGVSDGFFVFCVCTFGLCFIFGCKAWFNKVVVIFFLDDKSIEFWWI